MARVAAVPGGLALRANFELLQKAHDLAPIVIAIVRPLQRFSAEIVELVERILSLCPALFPQPIYHGSQNIRGDVVALYAGAYTSPLFSST